MRAAGFTTCYTGPGSANVIGGLGFAFKLKRSGNVADMMLPGTEMMKFALGHNPKNIYGTQKKTPGTRIGIAALLREQLTNAREYADALAQAERDHTKPPKRDFRLEPLVPVVRGERKVRIHCHRTQRRCAHGHPYRYAKELNPRLLALCGGQDVFLGWTVIDFGNARLASAIYGQNF